MIHHVQDNLLNFTSWNTIAVSCNCRNIMGAGLNLQLKEEYPAAWEADCEAAKEGSNKLGGLAFAKLPLDRRCILLYTQVDIGTEKRQVDYEALYVCLEATRDILEKAHKEGRIYKLGLPHGLSAGLAGGAWPVVESMIQYLFAGSPVDVYVVEYIKKAKS